MAFKKTIDELMNRPMDRAEFIKLLAIGVASLIGIARFLSVITHNDKESSSLGYGAGPYGGPQDGKH